jgi:predicted regulator of Ras-like GTPase activity (Roadblock/LC7/MglB family)
MSSSNAQNFGWLLNNFATGTAGVTDALAVSADGMLLASSAAMRREQAEQLAAIASGMQSLTHGAARCFSKGNVEQVIVEMNGGFLFLTAISVGSVLAVLAEKDCEIGLVAYEMALFVERAGVVLTPALIAELKNLITV